jgi:hypothetical protein
MLEPTDAKKALATLFRRQPVVDLATLCRTLDTNSRMSVFRRLKETGYRSSYTHRGAYYTLTDVPDFDEYGLWFHQGVGFSNNGTLRTTLVKLVDTCEAGYSHRELEALLRIRVQNTLTSLIRERRLARKRIDELYLYVSVQAKRATAQVARRRERFTVASEELTLPDDTVIEVLLEVIRGGKVLVTPPVVAERLRARDVPIAAAQAEQVYARYGIEVKKTSRSQSRPSRR